MDFGECMKKVRVQIEKISSNLIVKLDKFGSTDERLFSKTAKTIPRELQAKVYITPAGLDSDISRGKTVSTK